MFQSRRFLSALILVALICGGCGTTEAPPPATKAKNLPEKIIAAKMFDCGFKAGDSNYKALIGASDGKIYYVICCHRIDTHAQMYSYDPKTKKIEHIADMGAVVGEGDKKVVPQGKVHVNLFEHKGKLYTATHIGYYKKTGQEAPGVAKEYEPYGGGHFVSYDLKTGEFEDLTLTVKGEGVLTMVMDKKRERLYGLSWPGGHFMYYDLKTKKYKDLGPVFGKGEWGKGKEHMSLCRSFALDPRDGNVYWSNTKGKIGRYVYNTDTVGMIKEYDLNNSAFGKPHLWRSITWYPKEQVFYGIHSRAAHLFKFDPRAKGKEIAPIEPICAKEYKEKKLGGATLGFRLGPDGDTLYYMALGPGLTEKDGRKVRQTIHFVTYHLPSKKYTDHGALRLSDGRHVVYAQAIDEKDGFVYTVPWIEVKNDGSPRVKTIIERRKDNIAAQRHLEEINLIRFRDPYQK